MQSLLRTRPENLDDLTVQVALVRPGPIQGKAVHPYVKHRHAKRADPTFEPPVEHESLREPLRDTLGVVVFQDQVLDVAMAAAGFSIGEAEGLRRAMSRKRSEEAIEAWRPRFVAGASTNGIDEALANTIYDKVAGFAGFGFPKSHAAAFALLAYQSAWLRRYYPAEFLCALLNAQPMGFYPPSSLVRDAQRRGWRCAPPHINRSEAQCGIEEGAVRVGLAYVQSVGEEDAKAIVAQQPYADLGDLARRASVKQDTLEALVAAGACDEWGARRQLLWRLGVTSRGETVPGGNRQLALPLEPTAEIPELPAQTPWEQMLADYKHTSLSVGVHPLQLLRPHRAGRLHFRRHGVGPERLADRSRGDGDRAPAPVDRERDRLHAARGRARPGEPDHPVEGLRRAPGDRARRAADPRARQARTQRPEHQPARRVGRLTRPTRAPSGERSGSVARPPARPPLRTSVILRARGSNSP